MSFREVSIQLRIESADGRLAEEVASQLVAVGYDGNIESIWVSEGFLLLEEVQGGLEVPSDWLMAGYTERRLAFDTARVPRGGLSPYCLPSDVPPPKRPRPATSTPVSCASSPPPRSLTRAGSPADCVELSPSFNYLRGVVDTWVLAR